MAKRRGAQSVSPSELLRQVEKQLKEGWPSGLVVLAGDDAYHLDRTQRALLDHLLPEESREYALTLYGDEKVNAGTVVGACRSMGMFSERRVVFVRDLAMIEGEPDALLDYAADPAPDSFLIIRAPSLDRRKKLDKALAAKGRLLLFEASQDPMDSIREIAAIAKGRKLKLDREATGFLAQVCAGDLYRIDAELAKLSAYLGDERRDVSIGDVREVAAGEGMMSGWELANAILIRDRRGALAAARKLVESGDEPLRMLGGLAWRVRVMITAKAMQSQGATHRQIVQAARAWSFDRDLARGLKAYELNELLAFPSHMLKADRALKGSQIAPAVVLESLVDRMVGVH